MFDIAWSELLIVAVLAIIVVGPKDLPRMMRALGAFLRKVRAMAREFQSGMNDLVREAELEEVRKSVNEIGGMSPGKVAKKLIDPTGALDDPVLGEGLMAREIGDSQKPEIKSEASEGTEPIAEETAATDEQAAGPADPPDNATDKDAGHE